jgi:hypothetical protein
VNKGVLVGVGVVAIVGWYFLRRSSGSNLSTTGTPLKLGTTPMSPFTHSSIQGAVANRWDTTVSYLTLPFTNIAKRS